MTSKINLTQNKVTIVDDIDYECLKQYTWYAHKKGTKTVEDLWYASGSIKTKDGRRTTLKMHRVIMENILKEKGDLELLKKFKKNPRKYPVDHIDGNGLNNLRSNLRLVTHRQNMQNLTKGHYSSKYPGVYWDKHREKWAVKIRISSTKSRWVGRFNSEDEAFKAYKKAVQDNYHEDVIF